MDYEQARTVLRDNYAKAGFPVTDHDRLLIVKCDNNEYLVTEEDITTYAALYDNFAALAFVPCECSICSVTYREQVVVLVDPTPFVPIAARFREPVVFGQKGDSTYVEIGRATDLFQNRLRFQDHFFEQCAIRMRRPVGRFPDEEKETKTVDIRESMITPITIRVYNLRAESIEIATRKSSTLIEACLFELSYLKGIALAQLEEWSQRQSRIPSFKVRDPMPGNQLPLPYASYNTDIVRFYQRGISTRDPVIQFLSFYQVLEYYFIMVADEHLYDRLALRINDPAFSPIPSALDKIIQDISDHKKITDETEMLRLVLERYVPFGDISEFVTAYEIYRGDKHYTKRRQLFGQDVAEVKLEEGHLIPNIAKRIKVVRNAIVHSSDRYERQERYVPLTTRSEQVIRDEVPLIRFLAEKVIIATAHI